jgi:hypothetical protein
MSSKFLSSIVLLAGVCLAIPSPPGQHGSGKPNPPGATCAKFKVPITVTANNTIYDYPKVDSTIEAIDYVWEFDTWSHRKGPNRVVSQTVTKETFSIAAQLCVPHKDAKRETLQLATHGSVFTGRYADPYSSLSSR